MLNYTATYPGHYQMTMAQTYFLRGQKGNRVVFGYFFLSCLSKTKKYIILYKSQLITLYFFRISDVLILKSMYCAR